MQLVPRSVADFYGELFSKLGELNINLEIHATPNEVANPIEFDRDIEHASYDADYANRFWRILMQADRVLKEFRSRFIGKCSPVHFFLGKLRSGCNAVFRAESTGTSGRYPREEK